MLRAVGGLRQTADDGRRRVRATSLATPDAATPAARLGRLGARQLVVHGRPRRLRVPRGRPAAVGLVGLIRLIPAAIAAPFLAALADRYPARARDDRLRRRARRPHDPRRRSSSPSTARRRSSTRCVGALDDRRHRLPPGAGGAAAVARPRSARADGGERRLEHGRERRAACVGPALGGVLLAFTIRGGRLSRQRASVRLVGVRSSPGSIVPARSRRPSEPRSRPRCSPRRRPARRRSPVIRSCGCSRRCTRHRRWSPARSPSSSSRSRSTCSTWTTRASAGSTAALGHRRVSWAVSSRSRWPHAAGSHPTSPSESFSTDSRSRSSPRGRRCLGALIALAIIGIGNSADGRQRDHACSNAPCRTRCWHACSGTIESRATRLARARERSWHRS